MRFSVGFLPDLSIADTLPLMKKADELGFYAFLAADEVYHKDPWQIFALGAKHTSRIKFGPCVTHVYLNDPTVIARALGTLDEISDGRALCTMSIGNVGMLDQYHVDWRNTKPISRLREGVSVVRMMLGTGKATFDGDYFKYDGLFSCAVPKGKVPIFIGAMGGPRSFQLGGEIGDGVLAGLGYSKEFWRYAIENVKVGARKVGREIDGLDIGDWIYVCVSDDPDKARSAARAVVGFYLPSMPDKQLSLHGVDSEEARSLRQYFFRGDFAALASQTTMDLVDKLSISGTPDQVVEKIEKNLEEPGVNHVAISIIDPFVVKFMSGEVARGIPTYVEQLEIFSKEVFPNFE